MTVTPTPAQPQDVRAIRACVSDYYDGYFDGDAERMGRALHPALVKRSVAESELTTLDRDYMIEYTGAGKGRTDIDRNRQWEIVSLDVRSDIAAVVAVSTPFVDYLHLARIDNRWTIVNALWCDR